jgi:hypothetical protein
MIKTHTPSVGRMAAGFLGVLLALTGYRSALAAEVSQLTIEAGFIRAIAITPDTEGIAIGVEAASGDMDRPVSEVRWWNWNGKDGSWASPSLYPSALAWDNNGGALLVGDRGNMRVPEARWWRLGPDGAVLSECRATPRFDGSIHAEEHGIHSFAVLPDGKIVTGGADATLAVWEGCTPTWLHSWPCCHGDQPVTVTPHGDGFTTSGEAIWRGDEPGFEQLGPRRWSPSPWTAVPTGTAAKEPGLRADGEDCSATLDAEGRIAVSGARPWQARIGAETWKLRETEEAWLRFAVSRDCTAIAAATSKRLVWTKSP